MIRFASVRDRCTRSN